MPKFVIEGPDGATYEVEAPEGTSESEALERVRQTTAGPLGLPGSVRSFAGGMLEGIPVAGPALLDLGETLRGALTDQTPEEVEAETGRLFEEHPVARTAGGVTGAIAGTAPLAAVGGGALVSTALRSAGTSAAISGADVAARGGDAADIATGAAVGGAFGAAAPAVGRLAGKVAGGIGARIRGTAKAPRPELEMLRAQAHQLYDAADNSNIVLSRPAFSGTIDDLIVAAQQAGASPDLHPKVFAYIRMLQGKKGQTVGLREVDQLRQLAGDIAGGVDRGESRIASIMIGKLDDALEALAPGDLVAGDPKAGVQALNAARAIWRRSRVPEELDLALEKAELANMPLGQAIQGKVKTLLGNRKFLRGLSEPEKEALRRVVSSPSDTALAILGQFRNLVGTIGGGGGIGFLLGGPVGAAAGTAAGAIATSGARGVRSHLAVSRFEAARAAVSGMAPVTPAASPAAAAAGRTVTIGGGIEGARTATGDRTEAP